MSSSSSYQKEQILADSEALDSKRGKFTCSKLSNESTDLRMKVLRGKYEKDGDVDSRSQKEQILVADSELRGTKRGKSNSSQPMNPKKASTVERMPESMSVNGDIELGAYGVILNTIVRETEDLDSDPLQILLAGKEVNVVQVKGRRVRIDYPVQGWCSLISSCGHTILIKIDAPEPSEEAKPSEWFELFINNYFLICMTLLLAILLLENLFVRDGSFYSLRTKCFSKIRTEIQKNSEKGDL